VSRTEERLIKRKLRRKRMRNAITLFMCFAFFVIMIYVTDIKTSAIMVKKDGKHAVFFQLENKTDVRIDIAGETYMFNIQHITKAVDDALHWSKDAYNKIVKGLGS